MQTIQRKAIYVHVTEQQHADINEKIQRLKVDHAGLTISDIVRVLLRDWIKHDGLYYKSENSK